MSIKNRNGFTLIELLAVIVILAIVMVVTIPSVLNAMNSARSGQLRNATDVVSDWLTKQNSFNQLGEMQVAAPAYNSFIKKYGEIPSSLVDAATNNKNLGNNEWKEEAILMLETAGISNPEENIDLDNSYIWKGNNNNIDVKLVAAENGRFYVSDGNNSSYSNSDNQGLSAVTEFKIYGNTVNNESVGIQVEDTNLWNVDLTSLTNFNNASSSITNENGIYRWDLTGSTISYAWNLAKTFGGDNALGKQYIFSADIKGAFTTTGYIQIYFTYLSGSNSTNIIYGRNFNEGNFTTKAVISDPDRQISAVGISRNAQGTVYLDNIQLERLYYRIPITITTDSVASTINIDLDQPLHTGDYIDLLERKVYRIGGTSTSIDIPTLPSINSSTTVTVGTTVTPSNIIFTAVDL